MKALITLLFSLLLIPFGASAQSADEMLQKVATAIQSGQDGPAVSFFRQSINLNIDRSEMFYWTSVDKSSDVSTKLANELAIAYSNNRNYDKGYLFYIELLQKMPNDVKCMENVAEMQVNRGKENEALRMYESILKLDSDNLAANIFLGNYYYLMADRKRTQLENDYKKITSPTRMEYARYRNGLSELFASGYEKARSSLQIVLERFPSTEAQKTLDKIKLIEKEVNR